jgi:hypothetical protein
MLKTIIGDGTQPAGRNPALINSRRPGKRKPPAGTRPGAAPVHQPGLLHGRLPGRRTHPELGHCWLAQGERARCGLGRREGTRHELAQPEPAGRGIKPVLLRLAELGSHGKHLSWFWRSLIPLSGTNSG